MTSLAVLLISAGCGAYQFFKGNFVKAFLSFIISILSAAIAFGFFEQLSELLISRDMFSMWAQTLSLIFLFIIVFLILQLACWKLAPGTINLGTLPEQIGRSLFGFLSGLIISGTLIAGLSAAPLSATLPYGRFDGKNPNPDKPNKLLVNADGFAVGWFSMLSGGSLSGKNSFGAIHPDFLDQQYLNRLYLKDNVPILTKNKAIEVPKTAVWPATGELKDGEGRAVTATSGHKLIIARIGIRKAAITQAGLFTPSQLRLVCKERPEEPTRGRGRNFYPLGYLETSTKVRSTKLNEKIKIDAKDIEGQTKYIDFVFELPDDMSPVLAQFKLNNIEPMSSAVPADKAPPIMAFISTDECATDEAELKPLTGERLYGLKVAAGSKVLTDSQPAISSKDQWLSAQAESSRAAAEFEKNKIILVRARLGGDALVTKDKKQGLEEILAPMTGYKLVSLKCNNPAVGRAIDSGQLPVLVEAKGFVNYPVGVVAGGELDGQTVYQVDYCAVEKGDKADGLVIAKDGSVEKSFVENVWLVEQAQNITEFYLLYLIKTGRNTIISSVRAADSQKEAEFEKYQGFLIK